MDYIINTKRARCCFVNLFLSIWQKNKGKTFMCFFQNRKKHSAHSRAQNLIWAIMAAINANLLLLRGVVATTYEGNRRIFYSTVFWTFWKIRSRNSRDACNKDDRATFDKLRVVWKIMTSPLVHFTIFQTSKTIDHFLFNSGF